MLRAVREQKILKQVDNYLKLQKPNTKRSLTQAINDLRNTLRHDDMSHISTDNLADWIMTQRERGLADNTIRTRFLLMMGLFSYLVELDSIERNPCRPIAKQFYKPCKVTREYAVLTDNQARTLINGPDRESREGKRDHAIFALLFGCALRRSELVNLKCEDIRQSKTGAGIIYLQDTKAGGRAYQAGPGWVLKALKDLIAARESEDPEGEYLFVSYHMLGYPKLCDQQINRIIASWCEHLELPNISSHSGRATAITKLLIEGEPIEKVRRFARHGSWAATEVYDRRAEEIKNSSAYKLKY